MGSPAPRTRREERTATSRARILDAAVTCLVESGYAGATTLRIQARAGVSRGRLLHHFPSRDALLVAASRHLAVERLNSSGQRAEGLAGLAPAERLDRGIELMWATFSEPHFWAAVELWTAARTHDDPETLGRAERALAELSVQEGHPQAARLHYERAIAAFRESDDEFAVRETEALLDNV